MKEDQRIFILKAFNIVAEMKQDSVKVMNGFISFEAYKKKLLEAELEMVKVLLDWHSTHT